MALGEHLKELRKRILLAALGLVVGGILGWIFYDEVFAALKMPFDLLKEKGKVAELNFNGIAAGIDAKFRVAGFVGVVVSSPWWIYQIWAFIAPGLTKKERRWAVGFIAGAVPLFLAGCYMAWITLPKAVYIMVSFTPDGTWQVQDALTYLRFVTQLILAFGIAFLLPAIMVVLSIIGIVKGKTWLKGWRWAVIGIATFCAAVTPTTDIMTMLAMAGPMLILYFAACGVGLLMDRRNAKRKAALEATGTALDTTT